MRRCICDEPTLTGDLHRECALRSALGGIGHLLAHTYWCLQRHDPDAGLTYRQSAIMVDHLVNVLGVEGAMSLGHPVVVDENHPGQMQ